MRTGDLGLSLAAKKQIAMGKRHPGCPLPLPGHRGKGNTSFCVSFPSKGKYFMLQILRLRVGCRKQKKDTHRFIVLSSPNLHGIPQFHKDSEKISSFYCLKSTRISHRAFGLSTAMFFCPGSVSLRGTQQARGPQHRDGTHECFSEPANPPTPVCVINPMLIMFSLYFFMPSSFLKLLFPSCPHQRAEKPLSGRERGNGVLERQRQF